MGLFKKRRKSSPRKSTAQKFTGKKSPLLVVLDPNFENILRGVSLPRRRMSEETKTEQTVTEQPEEEPSSKKQKVDGEGYAMNINKAVDKEYEEKSFTEIADAPVAAIQGISDRGAEILEKYRVRTVRDLAEWKFAKWCEAITTLADTEEAGARAEGCMMNANKALDKEYETKSLNEIKDASLECIQGLTEEATEFLGSLRPKVDTVSKLGNWKFYHWAKSIVALAATENADFSSR